MSTREARRIALGLVTGRIHADLTTGGYEDDYRNADIPEKDHGKIDDAIRLIWSSLIHQQDRLG